MLHTPGDADDGNGEQETEKNMDEVNPLSGYEKTENVQKGEETSRKLSPVYVESTTEGPQGK